MAHPPTPAASASDPWIHRPSATADPDSPTRYRTVGLALAAAGLTVVTITFLATLGVVGDLPTTDVTSTLATAFATSVTGFGIAKLGIAVILVGIVLRLWHRATALTTALPHLRPSTSPTDPDSASPTTRFGHVRVTDHAPPPLLIHRMARTLWLPVLAMGAMALAAGLAVGLATSATEPGTSTFLQRSAWTQGTLFLGEGLLLSGISFLLGTILASLRQAGGEVQERLGVRVQTLRMPTTAKAFIALMALGMMMAIGQFVLYAVAATTQTGDPASFAAWSAWLGPARETALGVLLAGIVLALATISRVLAFQFHRIRDLVAA